MYIPERATHILRGCLRYLSLVLLLLSGCDGRQADFEGVITVTAKGTKIEVAQVLEKTHALDLNALLSQQLGAGGMDAETRRWLHLRVTAEAKDGFKDESWFSLVVTYAVPGKISTIDRRTHYGSGEFDEPVYQSCRKLLDDLFGRKTVSLDPRRISRDIFFIPPRSQAEIVGFMAQIDAELKAVLAEQKTNYLVLEDEAPVFVREVSPGDVLEVNCAEGSTVIADQMVDWILKAAQKRGWKAEAR